MVARWGGMAVAWDVVSLSLRTKCKIQGLLLGDSCSRGKQSFLFDCLLDGKVRVTRFCFVGLFNLQRTVTSVMLHCCYHQDEM